MENKQETTANMSTNEMAKLGIVTGLYVAITIVLAVISFGAIQIRLSEMFNYLSLYNKKYIWAVTLGVLIANLLSPLGMLDVVVGSVSTLIVLWINYYITRQITSRKIQMIVTACVFAFSMFTIAGQLTLVTGAPFFLNWLVIGLGELASMAVGGVIIYWVAKRIDFTK